MTLTELLEQGVEQQLFSGAACAVNGQIACTGRFTYHPSSRPIDACVLWDVASLTKIISTTTLLMRAWEQGRIDLDRPAQFYWPRFRHPRVTLRHLLAHRSGLPPYLELWRDCRTPDQADDKLIAADIRRSIPARTIYSCTGFLVLRHVVEAVYAQPLEQAFQEHIARPLDLAGAFNPSDPDNCVPTAAPPAWRSSVPWLQGEVHDPAAHIYGGISGNAGLFLSLADVLKWTDALQNGSLVQPGTLQVFTQRQVPWSTRALGFDTRVPGARHWSPQSFGHTGYTGTTIWIDPQSNRTAVLLTNRVHPNDTVDLKPFRIRFHELASAL